MYVVDTHQHHDLCVGICGCCGWCCHDDGYVYVVVCLMFVDGFSMTMFSMCCVCA